MQIKDYIQGNKHGKEANRLEREAMNDKFLQEALDGFDTVSGNHTDIIERLEKKIITPTGVSKNNRKALYFYSIAASVLLLIGFGVYFMWDKNNQEPAIMIAQFLEEEKDIEITFSESAPPSLSAYAEQMEMSAPTASAEIQTLRERQQSVQPEEVTFGQQVATPAITEDMRLFADVQEVQTDMPPVSNRNEITEMAAPAEAEYAVARRSSQIAAASKEMTVDSTSSQTTFGEKEFQAYCQKNAEKNLCDNPNVSVSVSFYIDAAGKPTNIKCDQYTCEDAKKEIERLLSVSPAWTTVEQQITMTVKW